MRMSVNVILKKTTVFISVASGNMADAPWVLGFPHDQLDEVIRKLEDLRPKETVDE